MHSSIRAASISWTSFPRPIPVSISTVRWPPRCSRKASRPFSTSRGAVFCPAGKQRVEYGQFQGFQHGDDSFRLRGQAAILSGRNKGYPGTCPRKRPPRAPVCNRTWFPCNGRPNVRSPGAAGTQFKGVSSACNVRGVQQSGMLHGIFQSIPFAYSQRRGVRFQPVEERGVFHHRHFHYFRQPGSFQGRGWEWRNRKSSSVAHATAKVPR